MINGIMLMVEALLIKCLIYEIDDWTQFIINCANKTLW